MKLKTPHKFSIYLNGDENVGFRECSGNVSIHEDNISIRVPASCLPSLLERLEQAYMEYDDYDESAMGESQVAQENETERAHFDIDKGLASHLQEYLNESERGMSDVVNCALREYLQDDSRTLEVDLDEQVLDTLRRYCAENEEDISKVVEDSLAINLEAFIQ